MNNQRLSYLSEDMKQCCAYVLELRQDEPASAAVLVKVALEWRAIGLVVAVGASDTCVWCTANGPARAIAVDHRAVDCQESGQIFSHTEDTGGCLDKLCDGSFPIMRKVTVVGQRIQPRAHPTGVSSRWRDKLC
nr:hypothetical protein CFP56_04543 [Quercus suber]